MALSRPACAWLWTCLLGLWLSACGKDDSNALRLGYFPNVTHAAALVGVERGTFERELAASQRTLSTATFNAGPAAIEALLSGALDASYIGPNPAINGHVKSKGAALRVIAGATSGGAFLVVKPEITSAQDLVGKT
ncbi:MAG: ABC transporter substrate-binding protein, partial [Deltaproteobacteria bacterium]|nr:ABC transporter substrate-binding protein [Nannocystaceae bacterium]